MRLRRQVYDLSVSELTNFPVWEFALDEEGDEGQDEATVRPWEGAAPVDATDGMLIVRASFQLADGTRHLGYLTRPPQGDDSIGTVQPVIVTEQGQVMFWHGVIAPTPRYRQEAYAKLRRSADQVFPIQFASDVALAGGPVRGVLSGFLHLRSFTDQTVLETT